MSNLQTQDELWVLDFEASGITKDDTGYPIEVGYTNGSIEREYLIRPLAHWTHWDWYAEKYIHKIEREWLEYKGIAAGLVCLYMNQDLAGKTVYCNGGKHDKAWCNKLFKDCGIERQFNLVHYQVLKFYQEGTYLNAAKELDYHERYVEHRALPDAKQYWRDIMNERKLRENGVQHSI